MSQQYCGRSRGFLSCVLFLHVGLLCWSARVQSPTIDEVAHMTAGLSHWHFANFSIYRVNPPLVKALATAPVFFCDHETDWSRYDPHPSVRTEWMVGEAFIAANGRRAFWLFTMARWACIPLSLIGGYICFRWASELYGTDAGRMAVTLWCFSPNIIAWGSTITPDVGAAALGIAVFYGFWKWLKVPTWPAAFLIGILFGLTLLTKMTWLFLFVYWPLAWGLWNLRSPQLTRRQWMTRARQLIVILLLGLYIVNMGYGFTGSFCDLGSYEFISNSLTGQTEPGRTNPIVGNRFAGCSLSRLPVPLPRDYVMGLDIQKRDFEMGDWSYWHGGEQRLAGWWWYYLYAVGVQVPLGVWVIGGVSCWLIVTKHRRRVCLRDEWFLLLPAVMVLVVVSSQARSIRHLRYVLPCFPFIFIWMSKSVTEIGIDQWKRAAIVALALVWTIGSSLSTYPHSLSYCNELIGGPLSAANHDVEVDWGQDLLLLKHWTEAHPQATPLHLDCYTSFKPGLAAIASIPIPADPIPGWYAVSIQRLRSDDRPYKYLKQMAPIASIGYSILIFHISAGDE